MGYEGLYEVSNFGNVRSLSRMTLGRWGTMKLSPGRNIAGELLKFGYKRVQLSKDGKHKHALVHRLVALAFLKPVESKAQVNHKDSNRSNNHVSNLEWCTPKENTAHGVKHGFIGANQPIGKSGLRGITYHSILAKPWRVQKNVTVIGYYATKEEAIAVATPLFPRFYRAELRAKVSK